MQVCCCCQRHAIRLDRLVLGWLEQGRGLHLDVACVRHDLACVADIMDNDSVDSNNVDGNMDYNNKESTTSCNANYNNRKGSNKLDNNKGIRN